MPHYGILRDYKFENIEDVRGADLYGVNDEKLGTIDDVIFDHSSGEIRYVVIEAGQWLSSKKFLLPMNRIQLYGKHEDKFYADLDRARLQLLPDFNDQALKSEAGWTEYERRYQERWNEGTVLYNQETGRIVTPPTSEVPGARIGPLSEEARRSLSHDFTPEKIGGRHNEYINLGVGPKDDHVTLRPRKASVGDREDVLLQNEGLRAHPGTPEQSVQDPLMADRRGLQEPGIYRVEGVPEGEKPSDMNGPMNASYGRRWLGFQQRLREGRDQVVSDCPLCGSQKKVA